MDKNPKPEPNTALPTKPNGPVSIPAKAPIAKFGAIFFNLSLAFLEMIPELGSVASPNSINLASSFVFIYPVAAPSKAPPTNPNGVTKPNNPPTVACLAISGAYFLNVSWTDLGIAPPLRPVTLPSESLICSPNSHVLAVSEADVIVIAPPSAAPSIGLPINNPAAAPNAVPTVISGAAFLISAANCFAFLLSILTPV